MKFNMNENIKDKIQEIINFEKNEIREKTREEEIEMYDEVVKNMEDIFTPSDYDTSNLDKGEDEIIKTEKMTVTLATTQNQKNNSNFNMTSIDLRECEILLRNFYNISNDELLYIEKPDVNPIHL